MKKMNSNPIKCQTVISKNLGPLKEWRKRLTVTKEAGYNVVHFTPIQELGASKSAYSIRNQHKVNTSFRASLDDVKKEVDYMEKKWGVYSLTDIVLNHTSDDSPWIREHPECAYNTFNTPGLRPAFLLDSAFLWIQNDLIKKDPETILTEEEIQSIGVQLRAFYVPKMKIWEMFMINLKGVKEYTDYPVADELFVDYGLYERYSATVKAVPKNITSQVQFIQLLKETNANKKQEICCGLYTAVDNAISGIVYERLDPRGPYYNQPISVSKPLVAPYFSHSADFKIASEEELMFSGYDRFMAHNGWVFGGSSSQTESVYLRRELVAWGDCIKLRYGSQPSDVPYLWNHMKKYVESQAKIFHGFRIDNCHSTPLHVAKYFLDLARKQRADLYVMAELFTSSEEIDNLYVNTLGINSLVRESMSAGNARELGRLMFRFGGTPVGAFLQHGPPPPPVAHAIFYDQTHDNESAIRKRSAYDVAATAAIINMANCDAGSTRGYDELVPHQIDVVHEERMYPLDTNINTGILPVRRFLNGTLKDILSQGFSETFVDQVNDDVIAMTRHNPNDGRSIVLIARTAFSAEQKPSYIKPIQIEGEISKVLFESRSSGDPSKYERDPLFINGLSDFKAEVLNEQCSPNKSKLATIVQDEGKAEIQLDDSRFCPSCILAVEVRLTDQQSKALGELNKFQVDLLKFELNLIDANFILFRCAEEEGAAPYEIPGFAKFTYCGLYGLMYYLEKVRENQDQAHPLSVNLRDGSWLADYIVNRLRQRASTKKLADILEVALKKVYILPKGMIPKYFDIVITRTYNALLELIYSSMSPFVSKGSDDIKLLALSSVALVGEPAPSIAAGLPHFSTGYMREWGRDTFISLRGLLLLTGRFEEAKRIILAYGRTLKHGLIPNLYDGGVNPRYNCRDAVWWWLYAVREYTKLAPNGNHIISQLSETIQEAMQSHFTGIDYYDSGQDAHMTQEGRRVICGVDRKTGFIYGGNESNCGTWMDKMGSSTKTGNKGKPASPRDGSAVEIVGLSKAVLTWLDELSRNHIYPHTGVETLYDNTITIPWPWKKWASLIQANFEQQFFIPISAEDGGSDPHPELINLRGIYKDTLGANPPWQDYQFRPNFLIAMVVAPELFNKNHAKHALELVKERLCGPLGMKTLDPSDWKYSGDYDNSDDSQGYNYHQGPEWVWLTGYYIRASAKFLGTKPDIDFKAKLHDTAWLGLPELTNSNGKFCKDSCPIQAWSIATALEALHG